MPTLADVPKINPVISDAIEEVFGITTLFPPQWDAMPSVIEGKNVLVSATTASGKTLIGYVGILQKVLAGGKALYLAPLKALASEKYHELERLSERLPDLEPHLSVGDLELGVSKKAKEANILVTTFEKADSLIRHTPSLLLEYNIIVTDEFHYIGDKDRGDVVETILTEMKTANPKAQLINISAVIPHASADRLAKWLNATLFESDWRPIPLYEGTFAEGKLHLYEPVTYELKEEREIEKVDGAIESLVTETVKEGGNVIVFTPSRAGAVKSAKKLRPYVSQFLTQDERVELEDYSREVRWIAPLSDVIKFGVAYHHAGLPAKERGVVEDLFRREVLKCVCSTPTLSEGVSLPVRRVILTDTSRIVPGKPPKKLERVPLPISEVKSVLGRAGRTVKDKFGEGIILTLSPAMEDSIVDYYLKSQPEYVHSAIFRPEEPRMMQERFRKLILVFLASDLAKKRDDLYDLYKNTFANYEFGFDKAKLMLESSIKWLDRGEFLRSVNDVLEVLDFGRKTVNSYLLPKSSDELRDGLIALTELGRKGLTDPFYLLDMTCSINESERMLVKEAIENFVYKEASLYGRTVAIRPLSLRSPLWFRRVKTAMILRDWIEELPRPDMFDTYHIEPGDLYTMIRTSQWIMRGISSFGELFYPEVIEIADVLFQRLEWGVREDLLEIIIIPDVGRVRARRLADAGYVTLDSIRRATIDELAKVKGIGKRLAKKIKDYIAERPT